MKFAERLKSCREELKKENSKWTQKFVADKIGVARVTYTAYENGTKLPPLDTADRIATLLNVTTDYLTGRSNDPRLTKEQEQEVDELEIIIQSLPKEERERMRQRLADYAKGIIEAKNE